MFEIANGLGFLHENGALHGDLRSVSPLATITWSILISEIQANIVVENGVVLLVDYGLASCVRDNTEACKRKVFEAPELWRPSGTATKESDIYSLGMTFYEVRTSPIR